jgi:Secretion system C-terminal sorting domain
VSKYGLSISAFLFIASTGIAQLHVFPISNATPQSATSTARTKAVDPLKLPFWDDFSFSELKYSPSEKLWQSGNTVWVNDGIGINPPSLKAATFDGLDAGGKPYSVNDVLAKGRADSLVSHPIQLDLVPGPQRNTVYLSFYYQFRGNGEPPDAGDQLLLYFKTATAWEKVLTIENDESLQRDVFYQAFVHVTGDRFFHDNFQFRFQNFGRLSGPYDTWNLDYVYLNSGRTATDNSYPDRTQSAPLTSLFNDYRAMPYQHFLEDPAAHLTQPNFTIYNLRVDNNQPMNYFSYDSILTYKDEVISYSSHVLDNAKSIGNSLVGLERRTVQLSTIPDISNFDITADSIKIRLKLGLSTKDNILPVDAGDYDPFKYSPIDFRFNDTTRAEFVLSNYYAYDDGAGEYGAGLNQPGAQLAYLFQMKTSQPDTLIGVDMYFPKFGDETSQVIQLLVFGDNAGVPGSILYSESITLQRAGQDKFWRHTFTNEVGVQGSFYLGWKQSSAAIIALGFDKNTDSGNKIYFNTNGVWEKNISEKGSLMIRPIFGEAAVNDTNTGLEDVATSLMAYPNPNSGSFYIPRKIEALAIFDITGRSVDFHKNPDGDRQRIDLPHASGIYILKVFQDGNWSSQKIMVQQP